MFAAGRKAAWLVEVLLYRVHRNGAQPDIHHDFHTALRKAAKNMVQLNLILLGDLYEHAYVKY